MDETVLFQTLDGLWEVGGAGRARGIWPEALVAVANRKGPDTCRFVIRREPGMPWPDLRAYTPVDVKKNGRVIWEGFVDDTPEEDDYSVAVQCLGLQHDLDHQSYDRKYVHTRLADWRDQRTFLDASLANFKAAGQVSNEGGAIQLAFPNGAALTTNSGVGVTLDLGPGSTGKRIVVEWEHSANDAGCTLFARGHDGENPLAAGTFADAFSFAITGATTGTAAGTFATARRYITLFLWRNAAGTPGADIWLKLRAVRVFADAAYESGGVSVLTGDVILRDALTYAPLIDGDQSGIEPQTFPFPEFAPTDDRTPGEIADAVNAAHDNVLKIQQPGRRPIFRAQPAVPILRAGPWPGSAFKDSSRNSGREIYNKAVVRGQGPAGEQLRIERDAASPTTSGAPQPSNPTAQTDTAGWSTLGGPPVRDTSIFDTSPASFRVDIPGGASPAFNVMWQALPLIPGTKFRAMVRARGGATVTLVGLELAVYRGDIMHTEDVAAAAEHPNPDESVWATLVTPWFRAAELPAGQNYELRGRVENVGGVATSGWFDDFWIETIDEPTIIDRRGFTRSKAHSMTQAINAAIGDQIAERFLATKARSPLKGELTVTGRGGVRRYLGDAAVEPAELLLYTNELVHLADQIDPDLGTIGRDGVIAAVTYNGDDERADVAIDNQRDNFEAVVERYQVVAGAGR